jgi:ABC-type Fe3+/spermidine/putrescine transport system ATPase subunit
LARALVIAPRVLLLDEPFSALDESLRAEMRLLVRDLQQRLRITTIFVTHDQDEAASMANRIALLLDGKLEQYGEPREFYIAPSTLKAARFFGWKMIEHENGWLAFRPESLRIKPDNKTTSAEVIEIEANVKTRLDLGTRQRYRVALQNGEEMEFEEVNLSGMPRLLNDPNASLILTLPASATRFFPAAY